MYQTGAIGFTVAGGVPKVGQLLNAAWTLSDSCTFKVLNVQGEKTEKNKGEVVSASSLGKRKKNWLFHNFLSQEYRTILCSNFK